MIDIEGFKDFLYEEELSENTISAYLYTMGKYSEMFDDITTSDRKFQAQDSQ